MCYLSSGVTSRPLPAEKQTKCPRQRSSTPRPKTSTGPWPVRNWSPQQDVSCWAGEASFAFIATPHHITTWAPAPVRSAAALDSHRSLNPTVKCACEGSRCRKTNSGFPLIPRHGEFCNYFIMYYKVIIKILCTISAMCFWVIPKPSPPPSPRSAEKLSSTKPFWCEKGCELLC